MGTTFHDLGFPPATYNPLDVLDKNDPNVVATAQSLSWAGDYWDLPQAFASLKQYYPHLYWEPPLTWDKNPLERVSR